MTAPIIIHRSLADGADRVSGSTVAIDTFRAFSTAAYVVDRGVDHLVLAETLDEARIRAQTIADGILCGEDGGRRPDDFELGNSPTEAGAFPDLAGRTVVMRTSAGTRTVVRALQSGAGPVYAASLVIAGATASAIRRSPRATIIASDFGGTSIADEETAVLISDRILGRADDPHRINRMPSGPYAKRRGCHSSPINPVDRSGGSRAMPRNRPILIRLPRRPRGRCPDAPCGSRPGIRPQRMKSPTIGFKVFDAESDISACVGRSGVTKEPVDQTWPVTTRSRAIGCGMFWRVNTTTGIRIPKKSKHA